MYVYVHFSGFNTDYVHMSRYWSLDHSLLVSVYQNSCIAVKSMCLFRLISNWVLGFAKFYACIPSRILTVKWRISMFEAVCCSSHLPHRSFSSLILMIFTQPCVCLFVWALNIVLHLNVAITLAHLSMRWRLGFRFSNKDREHASYLWS